MVQISASFSSNGESDAKNVTIQKVVSPKVPSLMESPALIR